MLLRKFYVQENVKGRLPPMDTRRPENADAVQPPNPSRRGRAS